MKISIRCLLVVSVFSFSCSSDQHRASSKDTVLKEVATEEHRKQRVVCDTLIDTVYLPRPSNEELTQVKPGKHKLTLQWISWNDPGFAEISEAHDGWHTIIGEQLGNPAEDEYIKINGVIKPVSDKELLFRGTIEMKVVEANKGEPCIKTGSKLFLTKGDRKYWRLQDMLNCDAIVTDYVDLYF